MGFWDKVKKGWNAFMNKDPTVNDYSMAGTELGMASYVRPDRSRFTRGNEKTIITSIYNRIALDVVQNRIYHVRLDQNGRYLATINSSLNYIFNVEANKDQTSRAFLQDIVQTMLDDGTVAICPIDTDDDIDETSNIVYESMRVGKIIEWRPNHVKVRIYNDREGKFQELYYHKKTVAIIENPFYSVMNEPNSTFSRLKRKLSLLDTMDEALASGKLNVIIQLPYSVKSPMKQQQADQRRQDIQKQLGESKYGIAYIDSTEKVTQLNRPLENKLLEQIQYLTEEFYTQLGITPEVINGTADNLAMQNYNTRIVEPILSAIVDETRRKFLSKTARSQMQDIMYFTESFRLIPFTSIADLADSLTRNEILSSNEIRSMLGFKPVQNEAADELRNKNINQSNITISPANTSEMMPDEGNGSTAANQVPEPEPEQEEVVIYRDSNGGFTDSNGVPVFEDGNGGFVYEDGTPVNT